MAKSSMVLEWRISKKVWKPPVPVDAGPLFEPHTTFGRIVNIPVLQERGSTEIVKETSMEAKQMDDSKVGSA